MEEIFARLRPKEIKHIAGAGNKFVHLATGKSDVYLNFVRGLKLWDTCAGDALIKARFGVFTNAHNEHIDYSYQQTNHTVEDGIIVAQSPYLLQDQPNLINSFNESSRSSKARLNLFELA